tara:strand:+ start:459 stop:659 length:201 start_codon:yes stop_codon:yes gene_type:complete
VLDKINSEGNMKSYEVIIRVEIYDCEDKQEAIDFVADNLGLSEFNSISMPRLRQPITRGEIEARAI